MTTIIKMCRGLFLLIIAMMGIFFCFSLIRQTAIKNSQKLFVQTSSIAFISILILLV